MRPEEFTSYWDPTDADLWEVVLDPTGMAAREINNPDENSKEEFNSVMRALNEDVWTDI